MSYLQAEPRETPESSHDSPVPCGIGTFLLLLDEIWLAGARENVSIKN